MNSSKTEAKTPHLFTVLMFRMEEGKRVCHMHLVAAFDSKSAEQAIVADDWNGQTLGGNELYIPTDEHMAYKAERTSTASVFYATSYSKDEGISDEAHDRWVRVMTRPSYEDGEYVPAIYRRFYAAAQQKLAA